MRELRDVATDAGALAAELEKANHLPADFPVEQLQALLAGLPITPCQNCRRVPPAPGIRQRATAGYSATVHCN